MGFHVHRSERTDVLAHGLARILLDVPNDPFTPEVVAVPTPGIERFLSQSLSRRLGTATGTDGVSANILFPSPSAITNQAIAAVSGITADTDPWMPSRMVWSVLESIDACLGQPWCASVARYLDGDGVNRRFALAMHMTRLFDSYAAQRPSMLLDWADGRDLAPADLIWQATLWRDVRERIGTPSPAERLDIACTTLVDHPGLLDLPQRLSLFGPNRLPTSHLRVFEALSERREVHLWLPDASPTLWDRLTPTPSHSRGADTSAAAARHPLLRSLGRDARELRLRLDIQTDEYLPAPLATGSLLGALQHQISNDVTPIGGLPVDASIRVHSCHGPSRQAEVIREAILGLMEADPALQPRDILVMCPDLDTFAPLLSAAFSASEAARRLRLRIADRTPEQTNEVLSGLAALIELLSGRAELSAVMDFAARPPVRARFRFDDDALERLDRLTTQAQIRWGLDDGHRGEFQVRVAAGTWAWGLDRLLLGAAMSQEDLALLGSVLPVDDVQSADLDLLGRFAELVTRLRDLREALQERRTVHAWAELLTTAITDLMHARGPDSWQLPNAVSALTVLANSAGHSTTQLSLADIRWLLDDLLTGRPTRANFRSGDLTICGLAPMRSVPHRVVCLVGLDDGTFPRALVPDGDDLLARTPQIGDRDPRSEDRQVLLDAIMAAEDHLLITFTGADERTNDPRPACVPLADLLDTLDAMTGGRARHELVIGQPLQPFDARNFTPGALGTPGPFSHDAAALMAAVRSSGQRVPVASLWIRDLPALDLTELSPREIGTFLSSPIASFLRHRVGVGLRDEDEPAAEQIPITLDGLQRWHIGNRTLHLLTRGTAATRVADAERARGELPPGALGTEVLRRVGTTASDVAQRFAALRTEPARQVSVDLALDDGMRVTGVIPDVSGTAIVRATYSKHKPRDDLRLWPELLALAVAQPEVRWQAHLVTSDTDVSLTAPGPDEARIALTQLVDLYRAGMTSPLPLTAGTGQIYSLRRRRGANPSAALRAAASKHWHCAYGAERDAPEVMAVWGPKADVRLLTAEPARDDENWFEETTRFGMLARRLWEPLIAAGSRE